MPRNKINQLNWGAEQRSSFIEFRVFWHGRINRADLMDTFGISLQQASIDLSRYADQWPQNIVYDRSQRAYVQGQAFKPCFFTPSAEDYLSRLRAVDQGLVSREQSWISVFPSYAATPMPARGVAPETLRDVLVVQSRMITFPLSARPCSWQDRC